MRCASLLLSLLAAAVLAAPAAHAAEGDAPTDQTQEAPPPPVKRKKKKKKKKSKRERARENAERQEAAGDEADAKEAQEPAAPSLLFPAWSRPGFDWTLGPVLGGSYASTTTDAGTVRTSDVELGLRGGVSNVPVMPGNPGIGVGAHLLEGFGVLTTQAGSNVNASTVHYKRTVGGIGGSVYAGCFRDILDVTEGRIDYDNSHDPTVQSLGVTNDIGILILPFLSGHYTNAYLRAFSFSNLLLVQDDNWLHGRVFTDFLSAYVDFGPGVTFATEYDPTVSGHNDYLQLLTGAHLFWKLGASGGAKYIIDSTEKDFGALANTRLPQQEVGQTTSVALPADSVTASFFAGFSDLFFGIGVGWRYDLQILNLSRRGGAERQTTKNQGFGANYSASF